MHTGRHHDLRAAEQLRQLSLRDLGEDLNRVANAQPGDRPTCSRVTGQSGAQEARLGNALKNNWYGSQKDICAHIGTRAPGVDDHGIRRRYRWWKEHPGVDAARARGHQRGDFRAETPLARQANVALTVGVQPISHCHGPLGVMSHERGSGRVQSEVVSPYRHQQRRPCAGIGGEHSFERHAHRVHKIRLNLIDIGA